MVTTYKGELDTLKRVSKALDQLEGYPSQGHYPSGRAVPPGVGITDQACRLISTSFGTALKIRPEHEQEHGGKMVEVDGVDTLIPTLPPTRSVLVSEGETPTAGGRFFDWDRAGTAIPEIQTVTTLSVGVTATAIQSALTTVASLGGGAVQLPSGDYTDLGARIDIPDGVVLRGAGASTRLLFPDPLQTVYGDERNWSFGGGYIRLQGTSYPVWSSQIASPPKITGITASASKDAAAVTVSSATSLSVGQWVRLIQVDPKDGTLIDQLYGGRQLSGTDLYGDRGCDVPAKVAAIDGTTVTLDRPLPMDVSPEWSASLHEVGDLRTGAGVEDLTIEFPWTEYPGHKQGSGYNGISLEDAWGCWVKDVSIFNSDYGVDLKQCFFCTLHGVTIGETKSRSGHHGVNFTAGGDNLVQSCSFASSKIHDITVEWYTRGNVVTECTGADLNLDHHRSAPYANLFTELNTGAGNRPWRSSGGQNRGPHTASYSTFWNIDGDSAVNVPGRTDFGPDMTIVGTDQAEGNLETGDGWHVEFVAPADIQPPNLWKAML